MWVGEKPVMDHLIKNEASPAGYRNNVGSLVRHHHISYRKAWHGKQKIQGNMNKQHWRFSMTEKHTSLMLSGVDQLGVHGGWEEVL